MKLTLLLCTLAMFFVSCQEEEFYEKDFIETVKDKYNKNNPTGDLASDLEQAQYNCDVAREENDMIQTTYIVDFPAAIECNFNEGGVGINDLNAEGNAPRIQGLVTARIKQDFAIDLPAGTTVCDMDFDFPEQDMEYDDEIILLVNNYVVMSSQNYSESNVFPTGFAVNQIGLQEYSWLGENGLHGLTYGWDLTPRYCLGVDNNDPDFDEKCAIPRTETFGQIKLEIPKEDVVKLGILTDEIMTPDTERSIDFSFVTTGDNDNGDCEHAAYSFEVTVSHVDIFNN